MAGPDRIRKISPMGIIDRLFGKKIQPPQNDDPFMEHPSGAEFKIEKSHDGKVTLPDATPDQLARFLDALFQKLFNIKPFEDAGDYAVDAEW